MNLLLSFLFVLVLLVQFSVQFPGHGDKSSKSEVDVNSEVSGHSKHHGHHKEKDSGGWKDLQSSSKGKLEKGKQDHHEFVGETKHGDAGSKEYHVDAVLKKGKDKGVNKKWNRGDGLVKKWEWNKGGHLEKAEDGSWHSDHSHTGDRKKKLAATKNFGVAGGGAHLESSHSKAGLVHGSAKKSEAVKSLEKGKKYSNEDKHIKSEKVNKEIERMKFDKYEKPNYHHGISGGWSDMKHGLGDGSSYHPSGYKGVDHGSIHGGRLSQTQHQHYIQNGDQYGDHHNGHYDGVSLKKKKIIGSTSNLGEGKEFDIDHSIDAHLPEELKSMDNYDKEVDLDDV